MTTPGKKEVLSQLSRILRSKVLRDSGMLRNFLSFIVKETLNPDGILLKQYSIALHAFNRAADFDPTSDPIVRIQASRLRRILDQYYWEEGLSDPVVIHLQKGTYVPSFTYATKEDLTTSSKSNNTEEISYLVAVKPLRNLSTGENEAMMAEGFTQEIMMELSRYSDIQVIRLTDEEKLISDTAIARFFLEGSMRFSDKLLKISFSLIDSFNHKLIWSFQKKIDIENNDLIQMQEDVAAAVAKEISGVQGIICKKLYTESNWEHIRSPQAYVTFIHYHWYDKNPSVKRATDLAKELNELLEKEPLFAPGHAVLTNLYGDAYAFGMDRNDLEKAIFHGEKAVELQPNNRICQAYYGYALMLDSRIDDALVHLDKAISLNPNGTYFLGLIGWCYCMIGKLEKGYTMINHCIGVDFQYPKWLHMGTILYFLEKKQYDKMLREATRMGQLEFNWGPLLKLVAYYYLTLKEEAQEQFNILCSINPDFVNHPVKFIECVVKSKALSEQIFHAYTSVSEAVSHHPIKSN